MTALLRAEARKVTTTRSSLVMAAIVVAYPALGVTAVALAPKQPALTPDALFQSLRGAASVLMLAALLLGILAAAGEHRHGTIVPSLLATPRRHRMLGAKVGAHAALGVILGLGASAVGLVVGGTYLAREHVPVDILSVDILATVAAVVLVGGLYATIGTSLGALLRNQTAAVTAALVWLLAVENAVPVVLGQPDLKRWLPGGAASRLLHLADPATGAGSAWLALVALAGLAALFVLAALVATARADVN